MGLDIIQDIKFIIPHENIDLYVCYVANLSFLF
jgi:hypothetical protein